MENGPGVHQQECVNKQNIHILDIIHNFESNKLLVGLKSTMPSGNSLTWNQVAQRRIYSMIILGKSSRINKTVPCQKKKI